MLDLSEVHSEEALLEHQGSAYAVVDCTVEKRAFKGILVRKLLGQLKEGCDKCLEAKVLCPWGCSGFTHNAGCVSFDAVMGHFFPFLDFTGHLSTEAERDRLDSSRQDFFSFCIGTHLFNPEWTVNASVCFDEAAGPVFLTCDDHHGGTKERYFHAPKSGDCLPPLAGDQLSFVVLNTGFFGASLIYFSGLVKCQCSVGTYQQKYDRRGSVAWSYSILFGSYCFEADQKKSQ